MYAVTTFPGANEKNWRVLVMIEQIVEDRKLLGPGNDADKKALVEVSDLLLVLYMLFHNSLFSLLIILSILCIDRLSTVLLKRLSSHLGSCGSFSLH